MIETTPGHRPESERGSGLAYDGPLRIGCLSLWLRAARLEDAHAVSLIFKQPLEPSLTESGRMTSGTIEIGDAGPSDRRAVPFDSIVVERRPSGLTVSSEIMAMSLDAAGESWRAVVRVRRGGYDAVTHRVHLSVMLHRLLLERGLAFLHAAAVTLDGRTFVFVGEKGAGKSTIALTLGRAGATILSDDHVLVRAARPRYFVSGCEERARVTAETEAYVFQRPLDIEPVDYAGTLKKELLVSDFFASTPHDEVPVVAMFFPRVGQRLEVTPRSARGTALDLIERTRRSYRPQDAHDIGALLDFWSGCAQAAPGFDLELSPALHDLSGLSRQLHACVPRS